MQRIAITNEVELCVEHGLIVRAEAGRIIVEHPKPTPVVGRDGIRGIAVPAERSDMYELRAA